MKRWLGWTAAIALAMPAVASGATRFATTGGINTGTCTTSGTACNITRAFSQAVANDTVSIGTGSYDVSATGITVTTKLDIVATTPASTRPTVSTSANHVPLVLGVGSNGSTVTHVAFLQSAASSVAMYVDEGATLTDVNVTSTATCIQSQASSVSQTLRIVDSNATQNGSDTGYPCVSGSTGPLVVSNSTISAPIFFALQITNGSVVDSVLSGLVGLNLYGASSIARRDLISGTSTFGSVRLSSGARLLDSIVTTTTGTAVAGIAGTATAENVTAIGSGAGSVGFEGVSVGSPMDSAGTLNVRNSIARAMTADVKADPPPVTCMFPPCGPGVLNVDHSDYVTTSGTIVDGGGNLHVDPAFTSASYHPAQSSPTIDAGVATANTGTTDFGVNPRVVGPAVDMGAWEFQGAAPQVTTTDATSITATSAVLNGTVDPGDSATSASFAYGDSTSYGATLDAGSVAAANGAHAVSATLTGLSPSHTYHVRLGASNALGANNGLDVTFTTPAAGGGSTPNPVSVPAPSVTKASFSPKRFRVAAGATALSAAHSHARPVPRGTHIRFTLSEGATATISFARAAAGRRHGKSCLAPGKGHIPKHSRCTRYVAVHSKLSRSGLAAGAHSIAFTGRLGKARLKAGKYRATIVATTTGAPKASMPVTASFTVV